MKESTLPEESTNNEESNQRPIVVSIIAVAMLLNGIITLVTGFMFEANPLVLA